MKIIPGTVVVNMFSPKPALQMIKTLILEILRMVILMGLVNSFMIMETFILAHGKIVIRKEKASFCILTATNIWDIGLAIR